MTNLLVRDLPDDVHSTLRERAQERGQSLQQYLVVELRRLAEEPTLEEVLRRIAEHEGGEVGFEQATSDLGEERARR